MPIRVGPEAGVDDFEIVFGDKFWIIAMVFVEIFFEGVIHGIDGGLAIVVAFHGVEVGFLNEK